MEALQRLDTPSDGNGTKTITLPVPALHKDLFLECAGTITAAMFTQLQVQANGKPTIDLSGTQLDEINKYDKLTAFTTNKIMRIPLGLIGHADPMLVDSAGLNCGVKSPKTKLEVRSAALKFVVAGATTPTFKLHSNMADADPAGPGSVKRYNVHSFSIGTSETPFTVQDIYGDEENALLRRVFFILSAGTMTSMRIQAGNLNLYDTNTAVQQQLIADSALRTAGSYFALVAEFPSDVKSGRLASGNFLEDNPFPDLRNLLAGKQSLKFVGVASEAATCTVITECLGQIPG